MVFAVAFNSSRLLSYTCPGLPVFIPLGTFFAWMCGFTIGVMQSIRRDEQIIAQQEREDAHAATQPAAADRPTPAIA
jgi:hypothetical protein